MCSVFISSLHDGLRLLAQVERQVVERADRLARRARALPAAERLVEGPGAGRRALRPVDVGDAGLDVVEEVAHVLRAAVAAGGEPERALVREPDALANVTDAREHQDRLEHLLPEELVLRR